MMALLGEASVSSHTAVKQSFSPLRNLVEMNSEGTAVAIADFSTQCFTLFDIVYLL